MAMAALDAVVQKVPLARNVMISTLLELVEEQR